MQASIHTIIAPDQVSQYLCCRVGHDDHSLIAKSTAICASWCMLDCTRQAAVMPGKSSPLMTSSITPPLCCGRAQLLWIGRHGGTNGTQSTVQLQHWQKCATCPARFVRPLTTRSHPSMPCWNPMSPHISPPPLPPPYASTSATV